MIWKKQTLNSEKILLISLFVLFFSTSIWANDQKNVVSTTDTKDAVEGPEKVSEMEPSTEETKGKSRKAKKAPPGLTPEQIQKKKEILGKILKFGSHKERKDAMRELIRFPKDQAEELYKIVSEILANDVDVGIKISCLRTLAEVNYKGEPEVIIASLNHKSDDVKEAAIFSVQKMKLEEASDELLNFLKNQDYTKNQTIINNAINSFGELEGGKKGAEFLESKFRDKTTHTNIRASIALYFGKVKDIRAENSLIDVATDETEDPMTRSYAINALGKMNSKKALPSIRDILDKINDTRNKFDAKRLANLKIYCIGALIALGDTDIMKDLMSYAKDDDPNVRIRAIKQLSEVGSKEAIELIEYKSQRDPSKKVQEIAKKLLEEMKKKELEEDPAGKNQIRPISPAVP